MEVREDLAATRALLKENHMIRRLGATAVLALTLGACSNETPAAPSAASAAPTTSAAADPVRSYLQVLKSGRPHLAGEPDSELLAWGYAACAEAREWILDHPDTVEYDPDHAQLMIEVNGGLSASIAGAPDGDREAVVSAALVWLCADVWPHWSTR
jgi:hypothetical protein